MGDSVHSLQSQMMWHAHTSDLSVRGLVNLMFFSLLLLSCTDNLRNEPNVEPRDLIEPPRPQEDPCNRHRACQDLMASRLSRFDDAQLCVCAYNLLLEQQVALLGPFSVLHKNISFI